MSIDMRIQLQKGVSHRLTGAAVQLWAGYVAEPLVVVIHEAFTAGQACLIRFACFAELQIQRA